MSKRFDVEGPYDLSLSLNVSGSFTPDAAEGAAVFRAAVRVGGTPMLMEVRQVEKQPPVLEVSGGSGEAAARLKPMAAWMLFADLALSPFYDLVGDHAVLERVVRRLHGLKPTRPATLFEMAVVAVTEQQISMAAAYQIRSRVIDAFGDRVDDLSAFPTPGRLAEASLEDLKDCGLSGRKAEYIRGLARAVSEGELDLERLKALPNEEARAFITAWRGFGPWSADYILVRGLGRPDCVPADDLGVRTVVGEYLGDGARMAAEEVRAALEPFRPYRGLTAFYLLADSRLEVGEDDAPTG